MPDEYEGRIQKARCECKTKHAVVPAHSPELWALALANTPLAPAVASETRFLGVYLTSRVRPHEEIQPAWSVGALRVCQTLTWDQAIRR